jgi:hypothetical protein
MDKRKIAIGLAVLVACGGSFLAGFSRRKIEIKEKVTIDKVIEYKDKIVEVEKIVYVKVKDKNVKVVKHEEKRPDGTVIKDTTITDNSKETTNTNVDTTKTQDSQGTMVEHTEKVTEIKITMLPDYFVQAGVGLDLRNINLADFPQSGIFSLSVSRRLFFSCYGGVQGQTDLHLNHPVVLAVGGCAF